jgi:hypothetical protein
MPANRLNLQTVAINATTLSGDNTIVSVPSGQRCQVMSYVIVADAANTASWKAGAATALSGAMNLAAGGGVAIAADDTPVLVTGAGKDLVLNLGSGVGGNVRGHVSYLLASN